jgi:hypothetical protein
LKTDSFLPSSREIEKVWERDSRWILVTTFTNIDGIIERGASWYNGFTVTIFWA